MVRPSKNRLIVAPFTQFSLCVRYLGNRISSFFQKYNQKMKNFRICLYFIHNFFKIIRYTLKCKEEIPSYSQFFIYLSFSLSLFCKQMPGCLKYDNRAFVSIFRNQIQSRRYLRYRRPQCPFLPDVQTIRSCEADGQNTFWIHNRQS